LWPHRLSKPRGHQRLQLLGERRTCRVARLEHAEADERLALRRVGNPDRRGFNDRRMLREDRFHFGRAKPLSRNLYCVVGTAEDVPQTILVYGGPVAMDPDPGEAR